MRVGQSSKLPAPAFVRLPQRSDRRSGLELESRKEQRSKRLDHLFMAFLVFQRLRRKIASVHGWRRGRERPAGCGASGCPPSDHGSSASGLVLLTLDPYAERGCLTASVVGLALGRVILLRNAGRHHNNSTWKHHSQTQAAFQEVCRVVRFGHVPG